MKKNMATILTFSTLPNIYNKKRIWKEFTEI